MYPSCHFALSGKLALCFGCAAMHHYFVIRNRKAECHRQSCENFANVANFDFFCSFLMDIRFHKIQSQCICRLIPGNLNSKLECFLIQNSHFRVHHSENFNVFLAMFRLRLKDALSVCKNFKRIIVDVNTCSVLS